jgi:hypothetical protein
MVGFLGKKYKSFRWKDLIIQSYENTSYLARVSIGRIISSRRVLGLLFYAIVVIFGLM